MIRKIILAIILSLVSFGAITNSPIPKPETRNEMIKRIAGDKYSIVCAIIQVESGWNANAISSTGDYGLMQINKKTWQNHFDWNRILEPEYNVNAGIKILNMCLEARNNDIRKALIYYNGSSSYPDKVFKQMELLNEETNKSGISGISY